MKLHVFICLKSILSHKAQLRRSLLCRTVPVEYFGCCWGNWTLPESIQVIVVHYKENTHSQCHLLPRVGLGGKETMLWKMAIT